MKKLLTIFLFASCTASQPLYKTGFYEVLTVKKDGMQTVVTFKGIKGSYPLRSDTTEIGDIVEMIKVKRY